MKVKNIAECSKGNILQSFQPSLSYHFFKDLLLPFLSGCLRHILLYCSHYCDICAKGFYSMASVETHRRTHTGERPFSCSLCAYSCNVKGNLDKHMKTHNKGSRQWIWERSGSVVECLTWDQEAAGSSLTGVTALWSLSKTHLFSLVLVLPRKTRPCLTERLLMGHKKSNQTNKQKYIASAVLS